MNNKLWYSAQNVILHYNDEAKQELIEYLEGSDYKHYGSFGWSDLSSVELYEYCKANDINHIWLDLWDLGGLNEDTNRKKPNLDETIKELRSNPDFLCAEIFNIPDLLFHITEALEDEGYYNPDEVEEFVYDNKQFIIESIQKFTCDVYNYGSPFEEITNRIRKEVLQNTETN